MILLLSVPVKCNFAPKWPLVGVHRREEKSKCREEDVYSTLLNSTLLSTGRVERCLMDDPDFSGSSPKAGIRWRAVQNQAGGAGRENLGGLDSYFFICCTDGQ